ncbi:MAG TPA: 3-methyl-2-oxobutanoate hydroxymethyltransferase, partial [Hyphomonadaceae bacterium]|nr:3-methyl-2-oxobutanoate hydroxymethyltransferase [Hyphomonadaceae bacterium]
MSAQTQIRRKTVRDIAKAKGGTPLVCLTAYDAPR